MWWLHDNGGRVVLIAHSQGAMLATAALVQPGCRPDGDHPSLITFGSPVVKLYGWGFPAYVTTDLLTILAPDGLGGVDDWCNYFYRPTPSAGPCLWTCPGPAATGWTRSCSTPRSAGTCTGRPGPPPTVPPRTTPTPPAWPLSLPC